MNLTDDQLFCLQGIKNSKAKVREESIMTLANGLVQEGWRIPLSKLTLKDLSKLLEDCMVTNSSSALESSSCSQQQQQPSTNQSRPVTPMKRIQTRTVAGALCCLNVCYFLSESAVGQATTDDAAAEAALCHSLWNVVIFLLKSFKGGGPEEENSSMVNSQPPTPGVGVKLNEEEHDAVVNSLVLSCFAELNGGGGVNNNNMAGSGKAPPPESLVSNDLLLDVCMVFLNRLVLLKPSLVKPICLTRLAFVVEFLRRKARAFCGGNDNNNVKVSLRNVLGLIENLCLESEPTATSFAQMGVVHILLDLIEFDVSGGKQTIFMEVVRCLTNLTNHCPLAIGAFVHKGGCATIIPILQRITQQKKVIEDPLAFDEALVLFGLIGNIVEDETNGMRAVLGYENSLPFFIACYGNFLPVNIRTRLCGAEDDPESTLEFSWTVEQLVLAAHVCLILGCLSRNSDETRNFMLAHLPGGMRRGFSPLVQVLQAFLDFQADAGVLTVEMQHSVQNVAKFFNVSSKKLMLSPAHFGVQKKTSPPPTTTTTTTTGKQSNDNNNKKRFKNT